MGLYLGRQIGENDSDVLYKIYKHVINILNQFIVINGINHILDLKNDIAM